MPEALLRVEGKPDEAGGLVINAVQDMGKPVHAGSHVVYNWEARPCGRRSTRIDVHMDAGLRRRRDWRLKGKPEKAGRPVTKIL